MNDKIEVDETVFELKPIIFNPKIAELKAMVEATKGITAIDLKDKAQLAIVRENRIALMKARTSINKDGMMYRRSAIDYQNDVIAREKELIAIIEPEEKRLASIEEEAKELAIREERLEKLPSRREKLASIDNITTWATDEELLKMDSISFETFYNSCVAEHNRNLREQTEEKQKEEAERIRTEQAEAQAKLDAERKAIDDERAKLEQEKQDIAIKEALKEVEEKAKVAILAKIEASKLEAERLEKEKIENNQKILTKHKAFTDFTASLGWTEATKADYKVEDTGTEVLIYKKVGTFKK